MLNIFLYCCISEPTTTIPAVQHQEPVQYDEQVEQLPDDQDQKTGEQQGLVTCRALYDYQAGIRLIWRLVMSCSNYMTASVV